MGGGERIWPHLRELSAAHRAGRRVTAALYRGVVRHTRLRPKRHSLRYSIFMLLLDLDRLEETARGARLFSLERFNLFSLFARDHGDGSAVALREQAARHLERAGSDWDGGAIRMLFMPRVLGYAFNPLTVYYCHRRDGSLAAVLYEVHNTFGERHSYLLPVEGGGVTIRQVTDKRFHVSPFMDMKMRYRMNLDIPGDELHLAIAGDDEDGPLLTTSFFAKRGPFTDASLLRAFFSAPFLGLKVIGGIHWEALKLWRKGIALRTHPAPPDHPVTVGDLPSPAVHTPTRPRPAG